jgi:uncharacterized protein with GYD domain
MSKYLMLGKYSAQAIKGIKAERTKKVAKLIKKEGGKVIGMYALIGPYDLAFLVDMPGNAAVMRAAIAIAKLTGVGFFSSPAITVEEFDKIAG